MTDDVRPEDVQKNAADFTQVRHHAEQLKTLFNARDAFAEEIRQAFHMEWADYPKGDWIKATMSPSAYNQAMGAIRLLTATEPQINVPFEESDPDGQAKSSKVERAAKAMWNSSGRVSLRPAHYEIVFSMVLFGESHGDVTRTADLLNYARASGMRGTIARMENVARQTPYMFHVRNPMTCYPEFDSFGLRGRLRRTQTTWGDVLETYGALAQECIPSTTDRTFKVVLNDWYDWTHRVVWLDNSDHQIINEDHELDFLPVQSWIGEGTFLFDAPEQQRQPLLMAVIKSGLWKRENLGLTVVYSLIHALGANPLMVQEVEEPANAQSLKIDRTIPAGVLVVKQGEAPKPLMERVVDPNQFQGLDMAARLIEQSTVPRQTLGEVPKGTFTFSAISLLSQSGRLPLVSPKESGGQMIGSLLTIALTWFKKDGGKTKLYSNQSGYVELTPADVPERVVFKVILEPDLPQDKLQLTQVADAIITKRIGSRRWVRENIMQMGQSLEMDKEIWKERRRDYEVDKLFAQLEQMAKGGQAAPAPAQPQQQGASEITPYPPTGIQPGAPLSGPLPNPMQEGGA